MNKRLVQRAMKKLGDQTSVHSTLPGSTQPMNSSAHSLIGTSAAAEEAMAARIRADIARADERRKQLEQQRAALRAAARQATSAQPANHSAQARTGTADSATEPVAPPVLTQKLEISPSQPGPEAEAPAPAAAEVAEPALLRASHDNVAHFDFDYLKTRGFLVPDDKTAKIHQEFRLIKRRLLDNAFGRLRPVVKNGRLLMVTSSLPGEGKTFSAINLAISIAIGGEHPVLLVDADIARPNVANTLRLDMSGKNGLTDYLDNPSLPLAEMLMRTSVPNLTLLPAGQLQHHPVDLLASASMANLVDTLKEQLPHHVIIFDSPPLLPVTETRSLSALVGQVLLVVAAGDTPRSAVNEALIQLENCEAVGLLFNKAPVQPKAPAYYGY